MHIRKPLFSIALSFFFSVAAAQTGSGHLEEQCEKQWIIDSSASSYTSMSDGTLLKQWLSREKQCASTSVYWGRLATVQMLAGDLATAKVSINRAPNTNPTYSYVVDLAKIQLPLQELLASSKPVTASDIIRFETEYRKFVKKHPRWPTGYGMLGLTQALLGKHEEAVENLSIAKKGDVYNLMEVHRALTISLSALGRHEQALSAADSAYSLNNALTGDPQFVYAAASSYTSLGYLEDAENLLKIIAVKRPEVKQDPEYVAVVNFYRSQLTKVKKK